MRNHWIKALLVALATSFASSQQTIPSEPSPLADAQPARVIVYAVGPGVMAPELLPLNLPPISAEKCKMKADGNVVLSLLVDATGRPRNLTFLQPLGTDLDKLALQIVDADRFRPGTRDGTPVVVGQALEVDLQACVEQTRNKAGEKKFLLQLRSQPLQKLEALPQPPGEAVLAMGDGSGKDSSSGPTRIERVGGVVSAPVPLISPVAVFTDAARRAKYQGICLISTIVDRNGLPQNVRVVRKLDYGLDQNAVDAVEKYRFKPAVRNGEPVPVTITVEVNFRLY